MPGQPISLSEPKFESLSENAGSAFVLAVVLEWTSSTEDEDEHEHEEPKRERDKNPMSTTDDTARGHGDALHADSPHSNALHNGRRQTTRELADAELSEVRDSLRGLRFGAVEIIVQDGVIVQINRTEKRRLAAQASRH